MADGLCGYHMEMRKGCGMMQLTLIDNIPIPPPKVTVRGKFKKWRYENNYRKGTKEKCCKNCTYCAGYTYGKRNFYKCNLRSKQCQ